MCIADGLGNNGDISVACRHYSGQYLSNFLSRINKEYGESIVLWLIKIIHELVMDNTKVLAIGRILVSVRIFFEPQDEMSRIAVTNISETSPKL